MFSSDKWFGAEAGFYNGVATQSLRFDSGSSAYLYRTNSSDSNKRIFTWSGWIKKTEVFTSTATAHQAYILSASPTDPSGSNVSDAFYFDAQSVGSLPMNRLSTYWYMGDASGYVDYSEETDMQFQDVGSWYHIVLAVDTTQSTASNRIKYYVNGQLQTTTQYYGQVPQNQDLTMNSNVIQQIGRGINVGNSRFFNGYMAEVNFVDGFQYDASYFGETKNGVWIPKSYTGSYGTNGYRLEFKNTSVGTGSSSTIGADTSGNNNHFTSSGIDAHDCNIPDSPENNWCTLNPLELDENSSGAATLEGNLKWTNINANVGSTFGFGNQGGKYYWEYLYVSSTDGNQYQGVTLQKDGISLTNAFSTGIALYFEDGTTRVDGVSGTGFAGKINADTIIQFKLDLDNGTLEFGKNNTYISALTLPTSIGGWRAGGIQAAGSGGTRVFVANYGQDSSFAGNKTAQGNADENGFGDFYYAVPTGFLAVCSANLTAQAIGPNSDTQADEHFNTVLYTGNATDDKAVTTVGFQPDWIWIKNRSSSHVHILYDSSRGLSGGYITTSGTNAESGTNTTLVKSFDSDGFTLGTSGAVNGSSNSLVSWNWKANGGTTSSNTDGSLTSTVQVNTTAKFSIITYTGNATAGATVGHGLGVKPDFMIFKSRSSTGSWYVYHKSLTANNSIYPNLSNGSVDQLDSYNDTEPTSSIITFGNGSGTNPNSNTMVGYIFAEVEGYSKFGSYTGNGSNDGTFVYTGFRPAWVLIKNSARSADWRLHDSKRQHINDGGGHILFPNNTSSENTAEYDIDFLSNGFKLRSSDVYENGNNELHIYMAFAEQPFKFANAR